MATHSIDIPGLLRNSLSVGVSIPDALSELIDNSLSAGSSEVRLNLNLSNHTLIASDNGHGMNQDKLEQSCCLHSRTASSSEHHGRFGFGSKQAEIILTNLDGPVTKLSSVDGNVISQITVNYPKILHTGVYYPQAGGIERDSHYIWEQHAINALGSGTISCITLSSATRCTLSELIMNPTVSGLRFKFATTYRNALTNGVKIYIQMGDIQHQLHPIDRMCSSLRDASLPPTVHFKHDTYQIVILKNESTSEIVAHVVCPNRTRICLDKSHNKFVHISEECTGSLEHIGDTKCSLAYSTDWNHLQKDGLEKNGITPLTKGQTGIQTFRNQTNGTELVRNGKIIKHFSTKEKKSGDHDLGVLIAQTRSRIEFVASEQMDEVFNVQVNKSQVNEDLIHSNVWKTIEQIRKTFVTECHKMMKPHKDDVSESEADSESVPSPHHSPSLSPSLSPSIRTRSLARPIPTKSKCQNIVVLTPSLRAHSQSIVKSETSDSASESGSDNQSMYEEEEGAADMRDIVPDSVREVGPSVHQRITRAKGEIIIDHWRNSGEHQATFDKNLDDMIKSYQDKCAPDQIQDMLTELNPSIKCNILLVLIKKRHRLPEDDMWKGIELLRAYRDAFGTNAIAGL